MDFEIVKWEYLGFSKDLTEDGEKAKDSAEG
jgi:hypothetical protein